MDVAWIAPIAAGALAILLEVVRRVLMRGADRREARKDLRQEIHELWERIGQLEKENTGFRVQVAELAYYKDRYTATATENEDLRRRVRELEKQNREHETQIIVLQRKVAGLEH